MLHCVVYIAFPCFCTFYASLTSLVVFVENFYSFLAIGLRADLAHFLNCKLGNTERRDHHRVQALSHAHSIGPDFSAACIFAWSGHIMLCSNTGPISRDTEKDAQDLLCNAIQYIQQCSEMQWFAQALKLYKADLHLTLAKSYRLRNNFEALQECSILCTYVHYLCG